MNHRSAEETFDIIIMKAPDVFGVIVRTIGFLLIIYGLWYVWYALDSIPAALLGRDGADRSWIGYLIFGLPVITLGALFFFCADWIVRLTYRDPRA